MGTNMSCKTVCLCMETWVWGARVLFTSTATCRNEGDTGVRRAGLRNCRRAQERYQAHPDCRRLPGNWCSDKTCAAGYTFSPVNQDCEHTSPVQRACLWYRDAGLHQDCIWACAHLEGVGRSALGRLLEMGNLWFLSLNVVWGVAA